MIIEMVSVISLINITVRTVLASVEFIIMDTHMSLHFRLTIKSRIAIWFRALEPKIGAFVHFMHLCVEIQTFLNTFIENYGSINVKP